MKGDQTTWLISNVRPYIHFQLLKCSPLYNVVAFPSPITHRKLNSKLAYKPGILSPLLDLFAKYFYLLIIHDSEAVSLRFLLIDVSFFLLLFITVRSQKV